ncbi:MAG TPA: hypothetical protein VHV76_05040 [Mycobacteriales bacterium]|jgi:hypothetical protein|nr:hypothetical protein [Mycobacteriales bacterium]
MRAAADDPTSTPPLGDDLRAALSKAHEAAQALLEDPDGKRLDAISWLSAHVAAFEHAVYPVAKHRLTDGPALVDEDRKVVGQLTRTLRIAERLHSGDVLASNLSAEGLRDRLSDLVTEHSAVQKRIIDGLEKALDQAEVSYLAKSYADALAHAPTRPHPHVGSGMMFRLDSLRDRILDTMDGRHVPIPRIPRSRIIPGRWGSYLLGQPHQPPAPTGDEPPGAP